jgi:hypothetical protein
MERKAVEVREVTDNEWETNIESFKEAGAIRTNV